MKIVIYFMKYFKSALITFILFFIIVAAHAQTEKKLWNANDPLQWSDYHGRPDKRSPFSAYTYFGLDYSYLRKGNGPYQFTFEVSSYMNKALSWKRGTPSENLLKHEQLHFDIAEYFVRQLLISFGNHTYTSNYKVEIAQVQQQIASLRRGVEELYDKQTIHSTNREMQAKWDTYVADLLNKNYTLEQAIANLPK
jgi:hypothetical protein